MGDFPKCPRCGSVVDMNDCEIYCSHTTYWADDAIKPHTCDKCNFDFHLKEHVSRHWTAVSPSSADMEDA